MNATDETSPPPPPPPRPEAIRRLTRSTDDKVLTGLCGGLGRYFGIDPLIFRVAFVVLALAGGTGILLYLVGWLLIPDDQGHTVVGPRMGQHRARQLVLAGLVAVGICLLFSGFDDGRHPDFAVPLVIAAVAAAVLLAKRDQLAPPPPPGPQGSPGSQGPLSPPGSPPPPPPPAPGAPPPGPPAVPSTPPPAPPTPASGPSAPLPPADGPGGAGSAPPLLAPSPLSAAPVAPPPRPRSVLVAVTLSILAVLGGTLALVGVPLAVALALLLLVTGAGLVIGAWRGRARWLIPVALVLGASLAAASVVDVPLRGGMGDRIYRPDTVAQLHPTYRMAVGEIVLDLRALDLLQGASAKVLVTDGVGHVQVLVPRSATVVAVGHAGAGEVRLFDWSWSGTGVDRSRTIPGVEGGGRLVVEARVGLGQVEVSHAEA